MVAVDRHLPRGLARLAHARLAYVEGDLTRLPLPDASLDVAFSTPPSAWHSAARDDVPPSRSIPCPGQKIIQVSMA